MAPDDRTDDAPREQPADGPAGAPGPGAAGEPEEPGRLKGLKRWARGNAPPLHTFLVSQEKPFPFLREVAVGAVVLLVAATLLWGGTGQNLGNSPVVVIESGSMMHCDQGRGFQPSSLCEGTFGRVGTIDPGDLVFVRDIDGRADVATFAQEARCEPSDLDDDCRCGHDTYGACGDVIIYKPGGSSAKTPIIHRAMFWLQIHGDGTYSVPECGLERVERSDLSDTCLFHMSARSLANEHRLDGLGPEDSGFVTLGDNNGQADLPSISYLPVRPEWILGKARGEVPWVGLVKLGVSDFATGCGRDPRIPCNYDNAPPDVKTMMWITIAVLVAAPFVVEKVQAYRHRDDEE